MWFCAAILGIGVTQLIPVLGGIGATQATPTPGQSALFTATPDPTPPATPSPTPVPTVVPTPVPTPTPTPIPTPEPTAPPKPGSPGAPRSLAAVASIGHIALSWSAPSSNGGSPITRYDIYRDGAGRPFRSVTTRSYTDTVANGSTHQYRVTAVNSVGSSAYSKVATGTTPNVPGVPGNPQAQGGAGQIVLTWLAPAGNGSSITRYDIYRNGAVTPTYSVTTLSKIDTGLAAGTTYTYIVKAVNAVGAGAGGLAFATTASVPGAPASLFASADAPGQIQLTWFAPGSNGNSPITGYDIYRDGAGTPTYTTTTTSYTNTGLAAGATYTYIVKAVNAVGSSLGSSAAASTADVPGAPTSLTATGSVGQIVLSWSAPSSNGNPITRYDIYRNGAVTPTYSVTTLTKVDTGLATAYRTYYIVKAVNAVGSGAGSSVVATTDNVPGAPATVTATGGNAQVTVTWTAPGSNGGSAISSYQVYRAGTSSPICTGLAQPCTDSGRADGFTHTYTVRARNVVGLGPGTSDSATTWNVPGAPAAVTATGGNGQITVTWTAPGSNGGSAIFSYEVYRVGTPSPICSGLSQPCTDSGLGDGVTFTYTVRARNAVGLGPGTSDSATTWNLPGAPATVTATGGNAQVTVTWTAPGSNGGSSIFSYEVYRAGTSSPICTGLSQPCTDSGRADGFTYTYTVRARNAVGLGPGTSDSATTWDVPDAPGNFTATGGVGQIALSWAAPAPNGSAITQYDIFRDGGGSVYNTTTTPGYTKKRVGKVGAKQKNRVKARGGGEKKQKQKNHPHPTQTPPPPGIKKKKVKNLIGRRPGKKTKPKKKMKRMGKGSAGTGAS